MYYLQIGEKTDRYIDPKAAGKAFYQADTDKSPMLTIKEGDKVITLADTFKGRGPEGQEYGVKRIHEAAKNETGFINGYYKEVETSLNKKLKAVHWDAVDPAQKGKEPNIDHTIYDDITALAAKDPNKAEKIWAIYAPKEYAYSSFVKPVKALENEEKKAVHKIPGDKEEETGNWNNYIEHDDAVERARKNRARHKWENEKTELGNKADAKRIEVEELTEEEKIQGRDNEDAERNNQQPNWSKQELTEREKDHQIALMKQVNKQFHNTGKEYKYKDQKGVAFKEKGSKIITQSNEDRVARAMATVAAAKGWKTLTVYGHPDFRREVWLAATAHGIDVKGHKPSEQDLEQAEKQRDRLMKNGIVRENGPVGAHGDKNSGRASHKGLADSPVEAKTGRIKGILVSHGAAPYKNDPNERESYYVTLETKNDKQTIWGKDLKRSLEGNKEIKPGDMIGLEYKGRLPVEVEANKKDHSGKVIGSETIQAHRNTWEVTTDKGKVVQAVAAEAAQQRYKDPEKRQAAMDAVNKEIQRRERTDRIPKVEQYDHTAPARSLQQEKTAEHHPNMERTR